MADKRRLFRPLGFLFTVALLVGFVYVGQGLYRGAMTIHELLAENKELKEKLEEALKRVSDMDT